MHHDSEDSMTASRCSAGGSERRFWACVGVVFAILITACSVDTAVMSGAEPTPAPATLEAAQQSEPTSTAPTAAAPTPTMQAVRQVLVVAETLRRGTSVVEIVQTPTLFLSARALPDDVVLSDAIGSMAELEELKGFVLAVELQPGEQLLRSSFRDPSDFSSEAPAPSPNAIVDVPPGHDAQVVVLPSTRAVQGLIRAGEPVRIVATSVQPDGQAVSTTLLEAVEVVGFDAVLTDGATAIDSPRDHAITVAVTPDEAAKLTAALAESAVLTLAGLSPAEGGFTVAIEMTKANALDGRVRAGNVVNILAIADSSDPGVGTAVASGIDVLSVSFGLGDFAPTYSLIVSVNDEELLAVTTAIAEGDITLAEP